MIRAFFAYICNFKVELTKKLQKKLDFFGGGSIFGVMNKKFIFSALCGGLLSSAFVQGNEGHFYAELKGGPSFVQNKKEFKNKTYLFVAGELGYAYDNFRFGFELARINGKTKDRTENVPGLVVRWHVESNITCGLINIYYDYALIDSIKLYIGAGLGFADVKQKAKGNLNGNIWGFVANGNGELRWYVTKLAYQLMTGISYALTENWTIKAGYRFFDIPSNGIEHAHAIEAGIRYNF